MQEMWQKAETMLEAWPFIRSFKGQTVVVKFGGSIMDDEPGKQRILQDIAFMAGIGLRPVIVHGGGKAISARMHASGSKPVFIDGLRVTDEVTIKIVEEVMNREINPGLVAELEKWSCPARGIHGDDIFRVKQLVRQSIETGAVIDWGYVGEVEVVDLVPVEAYLKAGLTPIITPLGLGTDKKVYNINADDAAAAVAKALGARKLVFLSDVPGVLKDLKDPNSLLTSVTMAEVETLIRGGVIKGGMIPKLSGALAALRSGVAKAHIIDAGTPHSLLLELFTEKGVGTEIVP